jgi:hypothetical protein
LVAFVVEADDEMRRLSCSFFHFNPKTAA